jgi:hypothetical protein
MFGLVFGIGRILFGGGSFLGTLLRSSLLFRVRWRRCRPRIDLRLGRWPLFYLRVRSRPLLDRRLGSRSGRGLRSSRRWLFGGRGG